MGTILIGGGLGGLLTWYGAVNASFPPHKLQFVAPASVIAVIVLGLGVVLRAMSARENALLKELRDDKKRLTGEVDRVLGILEVRAQPRGAASSSTVPGVAASVGAVEGGSVIWTGPQGDTGPQRFAHDEIHITDRAHGPGGP